MEEKIKQAPCSHEDQSSGGRQALVDTQNINIHWDECHQSKVQNNEGDLISTEEQGGLSGEVDM